MDLYNLFMVVFICCAAVGTTTFILYYFRRKKINNLKMQNIQFGNYILNILSPGSLIKKKHEMSLYEAHFVKNTECYSYISSYIQVVVSWVCLKSGPATVEQSVEPVINGVAEHIGATNFEKETSKTDVSGFKAIRATVKFHSENSDSHMESIFIGQKNEYWAINCLLPYNSEKSRKAANRIISSVEISPT